MATFDVSVTDSTVCLTGPESSGKTTLANALGEHFAVPVVKEVARDYLAQRSGYEAADLLEIARQQIAEERELRNRFRGLLVCDTDLLVIAVWWQEKFGELPDELVRGLAARSSRVYLLTRPDLDWVADPLRENPDDRARLFERYLEALQQSQFPYAIVEGRDELRLQSALEALSELKVF
jgi:nicotinamide riboside kinase